MVDDLAALLEDRGIDAAHIVGYSMGAETALAFAVEHPERVLSLTVAGSGWSGEAQAGTYGFVAQALSGSATFGGFMAAVAPKGVELTPEAQAGMMALLTGHGIDPRQQTAPLAAAAACGSTISRTSRMSAGLAPVNRLTMPMKSRVVPALEIIGRRICFGAFMLVSSYWPK